MYIKNPDWKHEKEWRLVDWITDEGKWLKGIEDESKHIMAIIFGVRSKKEHIEASKQILSEYQHIKFYQMKLERVSNKIIKIPL